LAERELLARHQLARTEQRRQLTRIELAEPMKRLEPGELANADEAQRRSPEIPLREPIEVPDEQQLIEEVMLEPEDDLVVLRERRGSRIPLIVGSQCVRVGDVSNGREVPSARHRPRRVSRL
jgi:hypothetical protein